MIESRRWPSWIENPVVLVVPRPVRVGTPVCDPFGHNIHELGTIGLLVTAGDTAHLNHRSLVDGLEPAEEAPVDTRVGTLQMKPGHREACLGERQDAGFHPHWSTEQVMLIRQLLVPPLDSQSVRKGYWKVSGHDGGGSC